MRFRRFNVLAGSSLLFVAATVGAQTDSTPSGASNDLGFEVEEIVVSARRKDESLQDVPQTVDAVTSDSIQKLNLLKFEDVQALVPGLSFTNNNSGFGAGVSLRGVTFETQTQSSSTVEFYLDDALIEANNLFQSMFDVGQIEVLRGPQGTLRGRAAPSGSITVTSRRPDLAEFGGYAMASGTDQGGYNAQGAINLPIISDVLAVRVAGVFDENEYDQVRSVNSNGDPKSETKGGRVSIAYQPLESVDAFLGYQYLEKNVTSFNQVTGSGSAGQPSATPSVPRGTFPYALNPILAPNFNGPALASGDRRSVIDEPSDLLQKYDTITANVNWHFAGQRLSYVGGYRKSELRAFTSLDVGNLLPSADLIQDTESNSTLKTHELRLASEERIADIFDYTAGLFYSDQKSPSIVSQPASFLSGAFGSPFAAPSISVYDERYVLGQFIKRNGDVEEKSAFASLTWHISDATELTVGGRLISTEVNESTNVFLGGSTLSRDPFGAPALFALPALLAGGAANPLCAGRPSTYAGTCDVLAAQANAALAPRVVLDVPRNEKDEPFVYNASFSHRFNQDFMAYVNVGSSWRRGVSTLGVNNSSSPGLASDPVLTDLTNHEPEESTSYEIGFKAAWLDKRIRANIALYHQTYDGLIFRSAELISYLGDQGQGLVPSSFQFTNSADAVVDGVDMDATFQLTQNWAASFSASYADGHIDDDVVPCNDASVTLSATRRIALCESDGTISASPQWNSTLQSEYSRPIAATMDGFLRGLFTYYPSNDEQIGFQADSYGLLNLYLGVRDPDDAWEVSLFAKNATDTKETIAVDNGLGVGQNLALVPYFGQPGYVGTRFTPEREIGLMMRYSFGSR